MAVRFFPHPPTAFRFHDRSELRAGEPVSTAIRRTTGEESAFAHWCLQRLAWDDAHPDIVELGCGPGRDLPFYLANGCRVMAVDWSPTALRRTQQNLHPLPPGLRPRVSLKLSDAVELVDRLLPSIVDGIVANLSYMSMRDAELERLFNGIENALRPGGWHLYAVRESTEPEIEVRSSNGLNMVFGGPHEAPYRGFSREFCDHLAQGRFEPVERYRDADHHFLYVADRKPFAAP